MDEQKIDWTKLTVPVDKLKVLSVTPNYSMTFHNGDKQVGALDFNGPEMTFTGDAEESAKVFFDWIAQSFKGRLEQERNATLDEIALFIENYVEGYDRDYLELGLELAAEIQARKT